MSSHSPVLLIPPSPGQLPIYFLSLVKICVFWTFHLSEIIQYLCFCVRLLLVQCLSFVDVVVCSISTSFLFMAA